MIMVVDSIDNRNNKGSGIRFYQRLAEYKICAIIISVVNAFRKLQSPVCIALGHLRGDYGVS